MNLSAHWLFVKLFISHMNSRMTQLEQYLKAGYFCRDICKYKSDQTLVNGDAFSFMYHRPELVVKKLRYYARFIVVCLLLNKMDVVKDLVKVNVP